MEIQMMNIPVINTIIAELMSCWVYFYVFREKIIIKRLLSVSAGICIFEAIYLIFIRRGSLPRFLWPFYMAVLFALLFLYLFLGSGIKGRNALYYSLKAFVAAEFVASFEWQLAYYYGWAKLQSWIQTIIMLLVYSICYVLYGLLENSILKDRTDKGISKQELFIAVIIVLAVFFLSNASFLLSNSSAAEGSLLNMFNLRTVFDLMGVIILYAFQSRVLEVEARADLFAMDKSLKDQYNKYRNYQDSIELINMKYHDLRHQLEDLREQMKDDDKDVLIRNIESELKEYTPYFETGNPVLNALLDSRQIICKKKDITITAVADGKLVENMHVADICTIFGNALDNAIESVSLVGDVTKRLIHMEVTKNKNFILINVENTCEEDISMKNGIPVSKKEDTINHGYGIKSIMKTVEKYNGTVIFDKKNDWFTLRILLPALK